MNISQITSDIPGWLTIHEGQFLTKAANYVKSKAGIVVEIGSYCGKSTLWLAVTRQPIYAIDPHKGNVSGGKRKPTYIPFIKNLRNAGLENYVYPIVKTSKAASRSWTKPITLLFIDGLHDEIHAREDFALWNRYLINGGIIAMHDAFCGWEGAGDVAQRAIVNNPAFGEIGVVGSILYGIKGESSGIFRIKRLCNKLIIELCSNIYRSSWIPKRIQFVLVHKFLRIFLINRFTSF